MYSWESSSYEASQKRGASTAKQSFKINVLKVLKFSFYHIIVRNIVTNTLLSITYCHNISVPVHCCEKRRNKTKLIFKCQNKHWKIRNIVKIKYFLEITYKFLIKCFVDSLSLHCLASAGYWGGKVRLCSGLDASLLKYSEKTV